ncbi:MAG: DUF4446 family protein [Actinomycetes bacterium]
MPLSTAATLAAVGAALVAVTLVAVLAARLRRVEHALATVLAETPAALSSVGRPVPETPRKEVEALRAEVAQARADLSSALRHVAVVRYDAFDDLAGRLSFSAALLDDAGDGIVLSSINGRSETRTYAKGITAGASGHPLSPEEREAVARARTPSPRLEQAG